MPTIHPNIQIIKGKIPVLVSAPHIVPIRLNDGNGGYYIKPRENKIKLMLHVLCQKTGAWGIFSEAEGVLENWNEKVLLDYKRVVRRLILKEDISLFLDLHGAQEDRPFLIDYDFKLRKHHPHDPLVEMVLIENFTKHFDKIHLSNGFFRILNGPGRKTLTYYVRKNCGIPAVQLEYNRTARLDKKHLRKLIDITHALIQVYENSSPGVSSKRIELRD